MIHRLRPFVVPILVGFSLVTGAAALRWPLLLWAFLLLGPLLLLAAWDLLQPRHSILRNFPVLGHLRFLFEDLGPELHQYFVERVPTAGLSNRDLRTLA